jgi:hypothetical protein
MNTYIKIKVDAHKINVFCHSYTQFSAIFVTVHNKNAVSQVMLYQLNSRKRNKERKAYNK